MKYNNGAETEKFTRMHKEMMKICNEAGFENSEALEVMKTFDWNVKKSNRNFCRHNQFYEGKIFEDYDEIEPGKNPMLEKFLDSFTYEDKYFQECRYGWIEELDSEELVVAVRKLNPEQLEILTLLAFDRKTQREIAEILGISRSSVADRIRVIKNKIKKYVK